MMQTAQQQGAAAPGTGAAWTPVAAAAPVPVLLTVSVAAGRCIDHCSTNLML